MDAQLKYETEALIREFNQIAKNVRRDKKNILRASAAILVNEIKFRAPIGKKIHKRYSTPKINKGRRAAKGSGVVVATYYPGNLRFSISALNLRRTSAVFVGPKLAKGRGGGSHNNASNADGYYAHMVENGTQNTNARPFVAPAVAAVGGSVMEDIKRRLRAKIKRIKK